LNWHCKTQTGYIVEEKEAFSVFIFLSRDVKWVLLIFFESFFIPRDPNSKHVYNFVKIFFVCARVYHKIWKFLKHSKVRNFCGCALRQLKISKPLNLVCLFPTKISNKWWFESRLSNILGTCKLLFCPNFSTKKKKLVLFWSIVEMKKKKQLLKIVYFR